MPSHIVGSWFPTGYHGHFRNKSRNDFVCEYRILAKPQPPEKFLKRSMQPGSKNVFSHHDNRHSYMNDARIFEQGLGRKRIQNSTYSFKPQFISWMPDREYIEKMRPLTSTYHKDFDRTMKLPQQQLVERPRTSFDSTPTTTYRYSHCNASPNQNQINAMNNEALQLTAYTRIRGAKLARARVRETVASCLSWYSPSQTSNTPPQSMCQSSQVTEDSQQPPVECFAKTADVVVNSDQSE